MQRVVRAFPVLPGQEAAVRKFAAEASARAAEAAEMHQAFGVSHESWHLQQTPSGLVVIVITEVSGRPVASAASDYAASTAPFGAWFKQQVLDVSGIDPAREPLGPPTTCIYNWSQ